MYENYSDVDLAKYRLVHDFVDPTNSKRKGAQALAPLAGMNPGTLCNKVNPSIDTHHLTVDESIALQAAARSTAIVEAEAIILGGMFLRLGGFNNVSDMELLNLYARLHCEIGESSKAISEALEDGQITQSEFSKVRRENRDVVQALLELESRLESLIDY